MFNTKRQISPYIHSSFERSRFFFFFFREYQAMLAYQGLNTRYYAGRMVQCEFVNIPSWSAAICGKTRNFAVDDVHSN